MSASGYESLLSEEEKEEYGDDIIYAARFLENRAAYVRMVVVSYVIVSLLFVLLGIGIVMLIYTPVVAYIAYQSITSWKVFITRESIVYKARIPACIPCLGVNRTEKHILLSLVTDVALEQSWFSRLFGLETLTIQNAGQGQLNAKADVSFQGMSNANEFKGIVLRAAAAKRAGQHFKRSDVDSYLSGSRSFTVPQNHSQLLSAGTATKFDQLHSTMERIEGMLSRFVNPLPGYSTPPFSLLVLLSIL